VGEEMARHFARWSGIPFVGLRFSAIREPAEYAAFPDSWEDPHLAEWNVWSYVDARDVAQASRLALTAPISGADAFIIAAADTVMDRPDTELMAACFPGVPVRDGADGHQTLLSIDKARRVLGYDPAWSWRDMLAHTASAGRAEAGVR
jgi:nucleoside-diphosphate-sugar epimerase